MGEGNAGVPAEPAGRTGGALWGWLAGNRAGPGALRWGLVPIRLMVGVIFVVHGAQKAFGWFGGSGFDGTLGMFRDMLGFPAPGLFAVLLIIAELVGGILLIVGIVPRLAALAIGIVMIGALLTAHRGDPFVRTHTQQMILAACITMMIAGGGALSLLPSKPPGAQ
jgi:putative oxidoreductase